MAFADLASLCRHKPEVLTRLAVRGIESLDDLGELWPHDVMQLGLSDFVVRRRLLNWVEQSEKQDLDKVRNLAELCQEHTRTLKVLHDHGVQTLEDLRELEPTDVEGLELKNLVLVRRLVRYLHKPTAHHVLRSRKARYATMRPSSPQVVNRVSSPQRARSPPLIRRGTQS